MKLQCSCDMRRQEVRGFLPKASLLSMTMSFPDFQLEEGKGSLDQSGQGLEQPLREKVGK